METIKKGARKLLKPGIPDYTGTYTCSACGHIVRLEGNDPAVIGRSSDLDHHRVVVCPTCKEDIFVMDFWKYTEALYSTGWRPFVNKYEDETQDGDVERVAQSDRPHLHDKPSLLRRILKKIVLELSF